MTYCFSSASAAVLPIGPGPVFRQEIKAQTSHFPRLIGSNLEGNDVVIPEAFTGKKNLVIVAFERQQQNEVDSWLSAYENLIRDYPGLEIYELPVIKIMNAFIRFNINNGMRYGITNKNNRIRTITVYLDKEEFKKSLNINTEETIQVFLLDDKAKILWSTEGNATEEQVRALKDVLQ
jgi:phage terminase large subunit